ncbi:MAG: molybdopterin cofactor-binding domain-containing protein [bacterium]
MASSTEFVTVGKNVTKVDGLQLACGKAEFVDDVGLVGTLHAKILASPHAHARIRKIRTKKAEAVAGVKCILHFGNVARIAHTTAGQGYPEPSPYDNFMFDDKVRFVGDRVALVAAETLEAAEEACRLIEVDYEVLSAILDPEKAMEPGAPIIHDEKDAEGIHDPSRNIAGHIAVEVGNVEQGERESDVVVNGKYYSHYAQHCPLEPHVVLSYLDGNNRLVIRASTQVPFHARRIVAMVLQIPVHRVRVIKPRIGGGFGVKQEVFLEYLVGAVTLRTGRPCKLEFTRSEEFISSRTRHPHVMWMKIGAKKDGTIHLLDLKALSNTGAYGTHSLTVVCNAGSKALPMYNKAPHVKFWADAVYTNLPVGGAYRGYGGTQGFFAEECEIDELAEKLGMDALDLRRKNHILEGETSPVFKALGEGREGFEQIIGSCKLAECIDIGAREIGWTQKRGRKRRDGAKAYGVGCAILMQGSGIPGIDMGAATIKLNEDGSFNLNIGATDLGTGADTVLAQIAAEALAVPVEKFIITAADTDTTPFDTGAYASSTTYISGGAVKKNRRHRARADSRSGLRNP